MQSRRRRSDVQFHPAHPGRRSAVGPKSDSRAAHYHHRSMPNSHIQVYIVDDEPSICTAYARLIRSAKMQPRTFASVEDFMRAEITDANACVVSDVQFPGKSGLELPVLLGPAGRHLPGIFVTAHDTARTRDV